MHLAATELVQLLHAKLCFFIHGSTDGKCDQGFIRMQTGIPVAEMIHFQVLDWLNDGRGHHMYLICKTCKLFQGIEQECGGCTEQLGGSSGHDRAVRQLHCRRRKSGQCFTLEGRCGYCTVIHSDAGFLHEELEFEGDLFAEESLPLVAHSGIVTAEDLLTGCGFDGFIVNDAVASLFTPISVGDL